MSGSRGDPPSAARKRWKAAPGLRRPYGLLDIVCSGLCFAAGLLALTGFLARSLWVADVISLFRPYALIASALALIACLARRRVGLILVALVSLVLESGFVAAPALEGDAHPRTAHLEQALTVITFNCLGTNPNSRTFVAWARRMRPDILVLEELPPSWRPELDTLADVLPYRASQLQDTPGDTDVFSRLPMLAAHAYRPAPDLRTLVHAVVVDRGRQLQVFGIHPNTLQTPEEWGNRNNALELSAEWVAQTRRGDPALVLGDWNTPPWSPYFQAFLRLSGLKSADGVVWPPVTRVLAAPLGVRLGSPIDHVAASADIRVQGCWSGPELGSDHVPQICRLALKPAT